MITVRLAGLTGVATRIGRVPATATWACFASCLLLGSTPSAASAQGLPAGGTTSWEILAPEEIVTFVLFDPNVRGVFLPAGLRFVSARDAQMPEIQEHLKQHPEHAECARGHHAEYGMVTLVKDDTGAFQGEIRLDDLRVRGSALPHGDVHEDPQSGTQILFAPGESVVSAVVVAGANGRHMDCAATWSKEGRHPLSSGVFVGPTFFTTYETPLKGSAYPLRDRAGQ